MERGNKKRKLSKQQREEKRIQHANTFKYGFDHGYNLGYEIGLREASKYTTS